MLQHPFLVLIILGALGLIGAILGALNTAPSGKIELATYHFADVAYAAKAILEQAGVDTRLEDKAGLSILYVATADADRAAKILQQHPDILHRSHKSP